MNFQQLEYALAVQQYQHFGKAAESCNITQATLSAMIKKLEEELKIQLFDRSSQPILVTEKGTEVLLLANKIIHEKNNLLSLQHASTTEIKGILRLGIIPTIASTLLPLILPTILKENPELELVISEIKTEDIVEQLKIGKIDLGILATPLEHVELEETILYYEPMMLYGIKDKSKKYVSGKDVKSSKVWLLEEGNCFRNQSITICNIQSKQLKESQLQFEGSSFDTLLRLSDQFGGYTLVPELYYNTLSKREKKRCKPFVKPIPVREISLVHSRPDAKKLSALLLSETIKDIVEGVISTTHQKSSDLSIIGI